MCPRRHLRLGRCCRGEAKNPTGHGRNQQVEFERGSVCGHGTVRHAVTGLEVAGFSSGQALREVDGERMVDRHDESALSGEHAS